MCFDFGIGYELLLFSFFFGWENIKKEYEPTSLETLHILKGKVNGCSKDIDLGLCISNISL